METFKPLLLALHIAFGAVSLLAGPVAILAEKGGMLHRRSGIIFFYAMMVVSATSIAMAIPAGNIFLGLVGIFSAYLAGSGYRAIGWKKLAKRGRTPKQADFIIAAAMAVVGLASVVYGIWEIWNKHMQGIVIIVFGLIGLLNVYSDMRILLGYTRNKGFWLAAHVSKMVGAVIASYTAFLVVNNPGHLPILVAWLGPTVIGTAVIVHWRRRVKQDAKSENSKYLENSRFNQSYV